jgi:hypothetical protein
MKKEAFEAIFEQDGEIPDTGPTEAHLHAMATERRLPALSLGICLGRIEETAPPLCDLLSRAADGEALEPEEETLLFRGLHVLGGAQIEQSWPSLLRLLRRPDDELDLLLGDAITETLGRIAVGMFNGDADSLFEAIGERHRDGFVREALWNAATFLTWEGRIERERMRERLVWFFEDRRAADGDQSWIGWQGAIAHLGLRELAPPVEQAFAQGRVPDDVMELRHFQRDLAEAERAPDDPERLKEAGMGYIDDVLAALEWSDYDDDEFEYDEDWDGERPALSEPAVNPFRHIGRNDPCSCGSGKKAKKCCLAA